MVDAVDGRARSVLPDDVPVLRDLLDHVADTVLVYGPDSRLLWANAALYDVFGFDPATVVGTPFRLDLPRTGDATPLSEAAERGAESPTARLQVVDAAGAQRWADATARFVRDDEGAVAWAVVVVRDITDAVETETRFRLVAENASDVVVESGPDGLFRWVSPSAHRVLGWTPEQLLGHDGLDLLHPDDRDRMASRRLGEGLGEVVGDEFRFRCADGSYRWLTGVSHPVLDPDGRLVLRVLVLNTVPEQLRHEHHLAELDRARLRAVLDSELDARVILDAVHDVDGTIVDFVHVDANPAACAWNQLPRHRLIGQRLRDLFPADMAEALVAQYAGVVESGAPLVLDETPMAQGQHHGAVKWFDVRAVRVGDGVTVSWRDVTVRHEAAEALRASEQRYRALAAERAAD